MKTVIHYIHDPLCGWCYGAHALVDALYNRVPGKYDIVLHGGGLFPKAPLSATQRGFIRSADARIGKLTGQTFGAAYLDGLLNDADTVYDSAMPIRAILAADLVEAGSGLPMLKALQRAHYRSGLSIAQKATIDAVANGVGLDATRFDIAFNQIGESELAQHLGQTQKLMRTVDAQGFPTFVIQAGERFERVPHDRFYGDPAKFADMIFERSFC